MNNKVVKTCLKASCLLPSPVTTNIRRVFLFIYNAVMILTILLQSILSVPSLSLHLYMCIFFKICLHPLFCHFLSSACIVSSRLISAAFQLEAQMNMLHRQNRTWHLLCAITSPPRCFYHILAIGFLLTRSQRKRQRYFSLPFLPQTRFSLHLITVPDSWTLIKALHLTNNTNYVRSQKQIESSQSETRLELRAH